MEMERNGDMDLNTQISDDSTEEAKVEELSLWGYFVKCLKKYAAFSGRARRREFWGFYLFYAVGAVCWACGCLLFLIGTTSPADFVHRLSITPLYCLVLLLPCTSVFIRRMHDVGKSGWYFMYVLIPVAGLLGIAALMIYMLIFVVTFYPVELLIGALLSMIPIVLAGLITGIQVIVWGYLSSQPGPNKYGENPKGQ